MAVAGAGHGRDHRLGCRQYAGKVLAACEKAGVRAEVDLRNEKINYKVREHSLAKVPVMLVVGKREAEEKTVSIRRLGSQAQETLPLADAIKRIAAEAVPPDLGAESAGEEGGGVGLAGAVPSPRRSIGRFAGDGVQSGRFLP